MQRLLGSHQPLFHLFPQSGNFRFFLLDLHFQLCDQRFFFFDLSRQLVDLCR